MSNVRTSISDPIRVALLPAFALGARGRLGVTFAPGKQGPGVTGEWRRDLRADLERLRSEYGASWLVCLMEQHELDALKIGDLLARAEQAGMRVRHLPIPDGGVPSLEELGELVEALHTLLHEDGAHVVVHCKGGLGRSGMVAAACLVRTGYGASEAMRLVRDARPGAVETRAQEELLHEYAKHRPAADARPLPDLARVGRFRACLLGGALGDAVGYPVEFVRSAEEIQRRFGSEAPRQPPAGQKQWLVSDDTQMTLFLAEGLIRAQQRALDRGLCDVPSVVWHALRRWHRTQQGEPGEFADTDGWLIRERALWARRAPGNTNLSALAAAAQMEERPSVRVPPNDSKGCGAVMRAAPAGLIADSAETAFELGRDTGVLTHGHPSGYLASAYFAAVVHGVVHDVPLPESMQAADRLLSAETGCDETVAAVAAARELARSGAPDPRGIESLGGGWVAEEALAIALACALTAGEPSQAAFREALWRSIVHGGDSDSTGALTGNLLGAMWGEAVLPAEWLEHLELRAVTQRLAEDLYAAGVLGVELDGGEYPPM